MLATSPPPAPAVLSCELIVFRPIVCLPIMLSADHLTPPMTLPRLCAGIWERVDRLSVESSMAAVAAVFTVVVVVCKQ